MYVRVEVAKRPEHSDPEADGVLRRVELALPQFRRDIRWARLLNVYWLHIPNVPRDQIIPAIGEVFGDSVLNWLITGDLIPSAAGKHGGLQDLMEAAPDPSGKYWALERCFRPGVTDNVGRTVCEAFQIVLGRDVDLSEMRAASGALLLLEGPKLNEDSLSRVAYEVFCNELIECCTVLSHGELKESGRFHPERVKRDLPRVQLKGESSVERVSLQNLSDDELVELSRKRLWALNLEEMRKIRQHFSSREQLERRKTLGLSEPTDVEMEVLAQTWSEHCKHKIFGARVTYREEGNPLENFPPSFHRYQNMRIPEEVDGLFRSTISGTTEEIAKPWLLSVFSDNAGIVAFDEEDAICIKVETHNSPSALDPYGGALTGIVGVNRDILGCGFGAKPLFNTDVFCVAPLDYSLKLPRGLLHPRRILDGVRRGVEHGGNKSGIPTVNGALVFDHRYLGKPLVYCGTGGILPREILGRRCETKEIRAGDRIVMVGGRIGKDGIHGATFSSLALDETSPVSAVQLGDPITQKRTADFLLEARNRGLYRTLTDNGAGGLSSSVGELAELSGGARMDVAQAGMKYPGLKPYELVVSESQERMSIAVPVEKLETFMALAGDRGVEASDLGEFTDSGSFDILYRGQLVGSLDLSFLHKGVPRLELEGEWRGPAELPGRLELSFGNEAPLLLKELLARPNVASKEWMIRQYDHEVQGHSVIKPLHSVQVGGQEASGPNDGAVIKPKFNSWRGLTVGCGINSKLSDVDPYLMAQMVVDEAVRNVISVGSEYGTADSVLALVDNFCWPDPVGDREKTGWLVRACYGMREALLELGLPLVSGKDSMKNDFRGKTADGEPVTISVPPTLLMTATGRIPDIRMARTSDFKFAGDRIYLVRGGGFGLVGSEFHAMHMDRLRSKGGNERQVVLPIGRGVDLRVPVPDWEQARKIYSWLGWAVGKRQPLIKSVHDISDGGLLVSVAEGMMGRGMGAKITVPKGEDSWEFCFGEAFHSFVVTVSEKDAPDLEAEWGELEFPFETIGHVTRGGRLNVHWQDSPLGAPESEAAEAAAIALAAQGQEGIEQSWGVATAELTEAWKKEGYWE